MKTNKSVKLLFAVTVVGRAVIEASSVTVIVPVSEAPSKPGEIAASAAV
jgi:hypothetical protein